LFCFYGTTRCAVHEKRCTLQAVQTSTWRQLSKRNQKGRPKSKDTRPTRSLMGSEANRALLYIIIVGAGAETLSCVMNSKTPPIGTWSLKCHPDGIPTPRVSSSCSDVNGSRIATGRSEPRE